MTAMQMKLVSNWERKNIPLSEVIKNSLVGLDLLETLEALAWVRKEKYGN